jgi:hypothetical protein
MAWQHLAAPVAHSSLAKASRALASFARHLDQNQTPTMERLWGYVTKPLAHDATCAALLCCGKEMARAIDRGYGAGLDNGYHNRTHFKEVLIAAHALLTIANRQGQNFTAADRAAYLFSALIHDLDHDGTNNRGRAHRLENRSLARAYPLMHKYGVSATQERQIQLMVRSTDVSATADYVNALYYGTPPDQLKTPAGHTQFTQLARPKHTATAELAAMLRDADILFSAGISLDSTKRNGARLAKEWGKSAITATDHRNFLRHVVAHPSPTHPQNRLIGFTSQAGRFFNPNIEVIACKLEQAELHRSNIKLKHA